MPFQICILSLCSLFYLTRIPSSDELATDHLDNASTRQAPYRTNRIPSYSTKVTPSTIPAIFQIDGCARKWRFNRQNQLHAQHRPDSYGDFSVTRFSVGVVPSLHTRSHASEPI